MDDRQDAAATDRERPAASPSPDASSRPAGVAQKAADSTVAVLFGDDSDESDSDYSDRNVEGGSCSGGGDDEAKVSSGHSSGEDSSDDDDEDDVEEGCSMRRRTPASRRTLAVEDSDSDHENREYDGVALRRPPTMGDRFGDDEQRDGSDGDGGGVDFDRDEDQDDEEEVCALRRRTAAARRTLTIDDSDDDEEEEYAPQADDGNEEECSLQRRTVASRRTLAVEESDSDDEEEGAPKEVVGNWPRSSVEGGLSRTPTMEVLFGDDEESDGGDGDGSDGDGSGVIDGDQPGETGLASDELAPRKNSLVARGGSGSRDRADLFDTDSENDDVYSENVNWSSSDDSSSDDSSSDEGETDEGERGKSKKRRFYGWRSEREFFDSKRGRGETLLHVISRRSRLTGRRCRLPRSYDPTELFAKEMAAHPGDIFTVDANGTLPVHVAAASDHEVALRLLLDLPGTAAGLDVRTKGGRDLPLHLACASSAGPNLLRRMVLRYPPSLRYENRRGELPLEILASSPRFEAETFEFFVSFYPPSIEVRTGGGRGLLHRMLESTSVDMNSGAIRQILIKFPELAKMKDAGLRLPLHRCAALDTCKDLFEAVLTAHPAGAREVDSDGNLPIHSARSTLAVRLLVEAYPEGLRIRNRSDKLPLHAALTEGEGTSEAAFAMLDAWAGSASAAWGPRGACLYPLHLVFQGHCWNADLVRVLARLFPEALQRPDRQGRLPLHLCSAQPRSWDDERLMILELLLREFPAASVHFDDDDYIPLSLAISSSDFSCERVARLFIHSNPGSLRVADKRGRLVLHRILDDCRTTRKEIDRVLSLDMIELLAEAFPDSLLHKDLFGNTPLHLVANCATLCRYHEQVAHLHSILSDIAARCPEAMQVKNNEGHLPISIIFKWVFDIGRWRVSANSALLDIVRLLFCDGCCDTFSSPKQPHCRNVLQAALDSACQYEWSIPLMHFLVGKCPHLMKVPDKDGMLPLHRFLHTSNEWKEEDDCNFVRTMVDIHPESIRHKDGDGDTALHVAALEDAPREVINCLIAAGPESLHVRNNSGQAPFDVAVHFFEHGRSIDTLSVFMRGSPDVLENKDLGGKTPFHRAVVTWKGDHSQLRVLNMMLDACPKIAAIPDHAGMWPALSAAANTEAWKSNDESALGVQCSSNYARWQHLLQCNNDSTDSEYEGGDDNRGDSSLDRTSKLWLGVVFDLLKESLILFEACVGKRKESMESGSLSGKKRIRPG